MAVLIVMGAIRHDVFHCVTGYGIRPLRIDGLDVWSENIDHAHRDMEAYVEDEALRLLDTILPGPSVVATWLDAADVREDFTAATLRRPDDIDTAMPIFH